MVISDRTAILSRTECLLTHHWVLGRFDMARVDVGNLDVLPCHRVTNYSGVLAMLFAFDMLHDLVSFFASAHGHSCCPMVDLSISVFLLLVQTVHELLDVGNPVAAGIVP